jgi:monoterpene epsilon-lactone hydrolase
VQQYCNIGIIWPHISGQAAHSLWCARTPRVAERGGRACGRMWAGGLDPNDPRVSPLYGQLAGLPTTTVYAGSRDVLYPDGLRWQERDRASAVP